ncbi:MAG: zinc-ribbon domain-containing protein [Pyrinomonadaceae bacterium]
MVLICSQCNARLQLDDAKAPSRPFSVRCPKCQANVNHAPASTSESQASPPLATTPSAESSAMPFERPTAAPAFKPPVEKSLPAEENASGLNEIARLLAEALQHSDRGPGTGRKRPAWDRRKALVCGSPAYRETIAELLVDHDYEVFIADNMVQGLGRMREERMDVVVLDANFDPVEQGVAFITREVRLMRPSERRRLFLVYVTAGVRTMDVHAAFLQNVNLVINPSDVEQLPEALEVSIRHYNDLYRPFNRALDLAPI